MLIYEKDNKLNIKFDPQNGEGLEEPDFSIFKDENEEVVISANGATGEAGGSGLPEEQAEVINSAIENSGIGYIIPSEKLWSGTVSSNKSSPTIVSPAFCVIDEDDKEIVFSITINGETEIVSGVSFDSSVLISFMSVPYSLNIHYVNNGGGESYNELYLFSRGHVVETYMDIASVPSASKIDNEFLNLPNDKKYIVYNPNNSLHIDLTNFDLQNTILVRRYYEHRSFDDTTDFYCYPIYQEAVYSRAEFNGYRFIYEYFEYSSNHKLIRVEVNVDTSGDITETITNYTLTPDA